MPSVRGGTDRLFEGWTRVDSAVWIAPPGTPPPIQPLRLSWPEPAVQVGLERH